MRLVKDAKGNAIGYFQYREKEGVDFYTPFSEREKRIDWLDRERHELIGKAMDSGMTHKIAKRIKEICDELVKLQTQEGEEVNHG